MTLRYFLNKYEDLANELIIESSSTNQTATKEEKKEQRRLMAAAAPNRTTGGKINYGQFGNLVGLRPSPDNLNFTSITTTRLRKCNNNNKSTKTMKISGQLYQRFLDHSSKYYNVESYETILEDLLDSFDKHNQDKRWYNNNTDLNK